MPSLRARVPGREFVRAEDVLGPEIARAQTVDAVEEARHLVRRDRAEASLRGCSALCERGADVAAHGVVAGHRLVGALENDHVLLARERLDHGRFGEGADDVQVDGADFGVAPLAQVVDGGLDVLRRRAERDEHGVRVLGLVLGDRGRSSGR